MSKPDRPSSTSGNKRASSSTNVAAEAPAQRMRLNTSHAAADSPPTVRPPLSAAQRCAADALTIVFGFAELKGMARAARTCKAWLAAAAKEQPRGLSRKIEPRRPDRLAALCASSSPLKRHISRVACYHPVSLGLDQLTHLSKLPELTALDAQLNVADLKRLIDETGEGALVALQAAFPPKLRELVLALPKQHWEATWQLQLDAMPAMTELEKLSLTLLPNNVPGQSASLSLEPLLQLPRLTHLKWTIAALTVPQLLIIKQIATLQYLDHGLLRWTADRLSALCRPPHRLQRLQEVNLRYSSVDEVAMADLARLPALTSLEPVTLVPDAYAHLPRFPRLQRLRVSVESSLDAAHQEEDNARLVSALSACPSLTEMTVAYGECTESIGSQLVQAVPRLRALRFERCSLPSLRFLRHAPNLEDLSFENCTDLRLGHVIGIGAFAPRLECLTVWYCAGLRLDEAERQLLTPPGALGLPRLREFRYSEQPEGFG